jgi:iron complex outermembrane recepter protein
MYAFHVSGAPCSPGKRRLLSAASIAAIVTFTGSLAMAQQAPEQPPQTAPQQNPAGSNLPPVVVEKPAERPGEAKPQNEGNAERRAKKKRDNVAKQPATTAQQNAGGDAKDPTAYATSNASTATKTDTPIMVTPASIQVVPQQVLRDQQVITLDQALKNVSGVTVNGGGAAGFGTPYGNVVLRGFATDTIFLDGTRIDSYSGAPNVFTQGFANVDRIEVLKGPAAILYGVVEPGGIVNIVTKQPQSTPSYSIEEQAGSFGLSRTTINATGPLTQDGSVLYRLDTSYLNSGSQVDFVYNRNFFIAPAVQWNIDQANTLKAEFNYSVSNIGANFGFIPVNSSASSPIGSIINPSPSLNYGNTAPIKETSYFAALTYEHKFDRDWSIKQRVVFQNVSFSTHEFDDPIIIVPDPAMPSGFAVQREIFNSSGPTQNFNEATDLTGHFNTYGIAHTLLIGSDYAHFTTSGVESSACNFLDGFTNCSNVDLLNPVNPGTPYSGPPTPFGSFKQLTETAGLYIQDQLKLPYNFFLLGGARLQYIHETLGSNFPAFLTSESGIYADALTPRAGLLWQPRDWLSLYTSYSESYGPAKPGAITIDMKNVPPSAGTQWEYGVKTSFFGGKLTATAAYFDLTKTNIPTADLQNPMFVFVTGAVRSRGEEFDLQGEISPGWKMIVNYTHTDVRVTQSDDLPVGSRFGGVPIDLAHLWTSYEFQNDSLKGWKIGGGMTFRGRTPYEALGGPFEALYLPDAFTVDLSTSYQFNAFDKKWTAQLNATNIFNLKYLSEAELTSSGPTGNFNSISGVWGTPLTIVGSLKVEF